jgi:putative NIF3 family GTP cyclohydrolase 1 type 2
MAEEMGINLYLAGHYATETFGVRQLSEVLVALFGLDAAFVDHPTGL